MTKEHLSKKNITLAGAALLLLGLLLGAAATYKLAPYAVGSVHTSDVCQSDDHGHETDLAASACTDDHQEEEHGSDEHAGHEHAAQVEHLDDLENLKCEHQVATVDCNECRFEVGVVKIDPAMATSLIKTGSVTEVGRVKTLSFTGQVQLDSTKAVQVVPTGGGQVQRIEKFLGDQVQKGDVLTIIRSDDFGRAKAGFLEIQSSLELAEATFQREKTLYEKKVSSEADYLSALKDLKATQAALAAADKQLRLFGLDGEQIANIHKEDQTDSFADLVLRAPRSGTLIVQNVSVGQIVNTTESIYTVADLSSLWVWCDVYEKDLAVLHEQTQKEVPLTATVKVRAYESTDFLGEVDFVGRLMDEQTRTVKVRVQVKNTENMLRPGMFADVDIAIPMGGQMVAVPKAAVMMDGDDRFVFQHWKDDLWVRRDVSVGDYFGNSVELLSGVSPGAQVVTGGAFMLKSDVLREKMGAGCAE